MVFKFERILKLPPLLTILIEGILFDAMVSGDRLAYAVFREGVPYIFIKTLCAENANCLSIYTQERNINTSALVGVSIETPLLYYIIITNIINILIIAKTYLKNRKGTNIIRIM